MKVTVHLAQIYVPSLDFTVYGRFSAVHLAAGGQAHQALIGRTFLPKPANDLRRKDWQRWALPCEIPLKLSV